jgi:thymidine kinase
MLTKNPEFVVFAGPMMSGKTSKLLMTVERYKFQKQHVFAFKPKIDERYSVDEIVTHMGWKLPATCISNGKELLSEVLSKFDLDSKVDNTVIAVDELFMIPGVADELIWLYKNGITIIASTLELSSNCTPFNEVTKILPYATKVEKCSAVCTVCQRDAFYSWRRSSETDEILIGGSDLYEARCYLHHPLINGVDR